MFQASSASRAFCAAVSALNGGSGGRSMDGLNAAIAASRVAAYLYVGVRSLRYSNPAAIQGLHAQAKPLAYKRREISVTEEELVKHIRLVSDLEDDVHDLCWSLLGPPRQE